MAFDPIITITLSLLLSYVFVTAASHKWQDRRAFAETVENYRLLPPPAVGAVARLLPGLEAAAGIGLLVPVLAPFAAQSVMLLLVLYMLAIAVNLLRGRDTIDCGCGGAEQAQAISAWLLLRNAVLLAFAWALLQPVAARGIIWFDWTVIVLATAIGCLFYNIVNQLLVNSGLLKIWRKALRSQHG